MIRTLLLCAGGQYTRGNEELVQQWRQQPDGILWLDIQDEVTPEVRALLQSFGCDELAIKDCSRARHPPKVENFDSNAFLVFRGISQIDEALDLVPQQLGVWVGSNFLITVHSGHAVSVEHFLERVVPENLLQSPSALALGLLHFAKGRYLEKLMAAEERIGDLEDQLLGEQSNEALKELVAYRTRLRKLRRIFNYHQRMAETILNDGCPQLGSGDDGSYHIRRNLYDRCERVSSLCTLYYELCGDLVEGYISLTSHQLNNTMKILTIITAIFVPITFIAGLYGMNFDNMPELHYEYGYFFVLGVIFALAVAMIVLFKKIRWL
jgi:magnesium transporter